VSAADETWTWATVASTDPLRVRLDGDDAPLLITPENLAGGLLVGDRVWVQRYGRRLLVHGGGEHVRLGTQPGRNISPQPSVTLGPRGDTEPSVRLDRLRGSTLHGGKFYIPADNESNGAVALLTSKDGADSSRLRLRHDGQVIVNTYPTVNRPIPFATASGEVSVDALSNGSTDSYSVTYPSGRFTQPPLVFVNSQGTVPRRTFAASGNSTSGFTLRTANYSGGNSGAQTVHWFAVQMEV